MPTRRVVQSAPPPKVIVTVDQPPQPEAPVIAPEPPEKPPTDFWDVMQAIPRDQWGKTYDIMGWRMEPKVPGVPGSKGFLFQVMEPVSAQWMKQNYGGGKFRLTLQKNSRWWKTHDFDIEGNPKYDLTRENPASIHNQQNAGNDKVTELLGFLRDELQRAREQNNSPANNNVIEMLTNASEKAMEIVTKQTPGAVDSTAQLANLVQIVKGLMPAPASNGLNLESLLLKPLIEKLLTPVDPLAQLTAFVGIFEKIEALRGGGGGDSKPKDWKAMAVEGLVQRGPDLLKELRETLQVNREAAEANARAAADRRATAEVIRGGMPPANPGAPAPAAAPPAAAMPPASPLRVVPIDGAAPAAPAAQAPVTAPPAAEGMSAGESDVVAAFMKRRIVQMIVDGRDAEDVVDFIDEVDASVNDLLAAFSPDVVTTHLVGDPILAEATRAKGWNKFLVDAQAYIKEIRAEDDAIEAHATAVPS